MADITIRPPRRADIAELVANMRPLDRQELEATHDGDLHDAVRHALHISPHRWALDVNGKLGLLGGISTVSLLDGVGCPWLLGTTELDRVPGALTRAALRYRDLATGLYPTLYNFVDVRNDKAIRWLRRLGFAVSADPVPYGPRKMPFYRFERRF